MLNVHLCVAGSAARHTDSKKHIKRTNAHTDFFSLSGAHSISFCILSCREQRGGVSSLIVSFLNVSAELLVFGIYSSNFQLCFLPSLPCLFAIELHRILGHILHLPLSIQAMGNSIRGIRLCN